MNRANFELQIITPLQTFRREVIHLRLKDATGFFGIMKSHADFLTVLVPCLGYYRDSDDKEVFLAVDGGILAVRRGVVVLTSREVFEGEDSKDLSEIIESTMMRRDQSEVALLSMLHGIEKSFIEKAVSLTRGRSL